MNLTLKIWRQPDAVTAGAMHTYQLADVSPDMSFLEMLDVLNEQLNDQGEDPIAFDSDCREGICGTCGVVINGEAHGPERTTTCQLHMRSFKDGDEIVIEPWRADAFPVGAVSAIRSRRPGSSRSACSASSASSPATVVVLPVPGPPVSTVVQRPAAWRAASRCSS